MHGVAHFSTVIVRASGVLTVIDIGIGAADYQKCVDRCTDGRTCKPYKPPYRFERFMVIYLITVIGGSLSGVLVPKGRKSMYVLLGFGSHIRIAPPLFLSCLSWSQIWTKTAFADFVLLDTPVF
jgi:hypothetical protein